MLGVALMIVLAGLVVAVLPIYPYSRNWRFYPAGVAAVLLAVVTTMWLAGKFPMRPVMHMGGPGGVTESSR